MASALMRPVQLQWNEAENNVADQNEEMVHAYILARMRADGTQHEPLRRSLNTHERGNSAVNGNIVQRFNRISDYIENNPETPGLVNLVLEQGLAGLQAIFYDMLTNGGPIRWSQIILLLYLAYKLCQKVLTIADIRLIISKLLIFLRNYAGQWIINAGGWASIVHSPITPVAVVSMIGAGLMYLYHKYRSTSTHRAIAL